MLYRHFICALFLALAIFCSSFTGVAQASATSSTSFGLTLGSEGSSIQFGTERAITHGDPGYRYYGSGNPPPKSLIAHGPRRHYHPRYRHHHHRHNYYHRSHHRPAPYRGYYRGRPYHRGPGYYRHRHGRYYR